MTVLTGVMSKNFYKCKVLVQYILTQERVTDVLTVGDVTSSVRPLLGEGLSLKSVEKDGKGGGRGRTNRGDCDTMGLSRER